MLNKTDAHKIKQECRSFQNSVGTNFKNNSELSLSESKPKTRLPVHTKLQLMIYTTETRILFRFF